MKRFASLLFAALFLLSCCLSPLQAEGLVYDINGELRVDLGYPSPSRPQPSDLGFEEVTSENGESFITWVEYDFRYRIDAEYIQDTSAMHQQSQIPENPYLIGEDLQAAHEQLLAEVRDSQAYQYFVSQVDIKENLICKQGYYKGETNEAGEPHGQGTWVYMSFDNLPLLREEDLGQVHLTEEDLQPHKFAYVGEWEDGKIQGDGALLSYDEEAESWRVIHVGFYDFFTIQASGDYFFENGASYRGQFVHGVPWGEGAMFYNYLLTYEGYWFLGQAHGLGTLHLAGSDDLVTGIFQDGLYITDDYIYYKSGIYYQGEQKNRLPHGKGTMHYTDGYYEGDWVEGKRQGQGKLYLNSGLSYEGAWQDDKPSGEGVYDKLDFICLGNFEDWSLHGQGKMTLPDGSLICEGEFQEGQLIEGDRVYFDSGTIYEGDIKDGAITGQGKIYIFTEGQTFLFKEGEFVDGVLHGQGSLHFVGDHHREGEWKNGVLHGKGLYRQGDNKIYEGEFVEGQMQGQGTYWMGPDERFEGEFNFSDRYAKGSYYRDGQLVSEGEHMTILLRSPEGEALIVKPHGQAKLYQPDGELEYEGEFSEGSYSGHGTLYLPEGERYEGEFQNGLFEGEGTLWYTDGTYKGEWQAGMRHGYGELTHLDGSPWLVGNWLNDMFLGQ